MKMSPVKQNQTPETKKSKKMSPMKQTQTPKTKKLNTSVSGKKVESPTKDSGKKAKRALEENSQSNNKKQKLNLEAESPALDKGNIKNESDKKVEIKITFPNQYNNYKDGLLDILKMSEEVLSINTMRVGVKPVKTEEFLELLKNSKITPKIVGTSVKKEFSSNKRLLHLNSFIVDTEKVREIVGAESVTQLKLQGKPSKMYVVEFSSAEAAESTEGKPFIIDGSPKFMNPYFEKLANNEIEEPSQVKDETSKVKGQNESCNTKANDLSEKKLEGDEGEEDEMEEDDDDDDEDDDDDDDDDDEDDEEGGEDDEEGGEDEDDDDDEGDDDDDDDED